MQVLVTLENISLGYEGQPLFDGLTMPIIQGTSLAVLGANGAGKSSFAKMLLGLKKPQRGALHWTGNKPENLGYLAQMSEFDRRFPIRVKDLAAMGSWLSQGGQGIFQSNNPSMQSKIQAALEIAGVRDIANRPIHQLSGGQLQRALFARVIMQDAPLIILDEPFSAVDQQTEAHLRAIIRSWQDEGRAVVLIVHDLSTVLDQCDYVLLLGNHKARYGRVQEIITAENLVDQHYLSPSQAEFLFRQFPHEKAVL